MVTFFEEFLRNFSRIISVTDSKEILEKFPIIGPKEERILGDHSFETQFREIPEKFFGIAVDILNPCPNYIFLFLIPEQSFYCS